jgi:hypothetical protein
MEGGPAEACGGAAALLAAGQPGAGCYAERGAVQGALLYASRARGCIGGPPVCHRAAALSRGRGCMHRLASFLPCLATTLCSSAPPAQHPA